MSLAQTFGAEIARALESALEKLLAERDYSLEGIDFVVNRSDNTTTVRVDGVPRVTIHKEYDPFIHQFTVRTEWIQPKESHGS